MDGERDSLLTRLLSPESVAVVGASPNSRYGMRILGNLLRRNWDGRIYGVNPRHREVSGVPCFPRLAELPETPDLVVVATPAPSVMGVLQEAAAAGAGGAIVLAADVPPTERDSIHALGGEGRLAVMGPNCLGYVGPRGGVTGAWSIGLPDEPFIGPGAAVISQSGNLANHLLNCYQGLTFSYVISSGNQWGVQGVEYLAWLAPREEVRVLGMIVEGMPDPERFIAVAREVRRLGKSLVVLHLGRSRLGRAMAEAHTGALAAGDEWWTAVRRRVPFAEARDLEEFVAILKLVDRIGEPPRLRPAFAASSGGECGLIADLTDAVGLPMGELLPESVERLREVLPAYVEPHNPLDYGASTWGTEEPYTSVVTGLAADPAVDLIGVVQDFPGSPAHVKSWETMMDGAARAHRTTGKPVLVMTTMGGVPTSYYDRARRLGVEVFTGLRPTISAIGEVRRLGAAARADREEPARPAQPGPALESGPWTEYAAKRALSKWGVGIPRGTLVDRIGSLGDAAATLGYPLVLKAVGVSHKSDVGAVSVNLRTRDEVAEAAERMAETMKAQGLTSDAWLLEEYLGGRLEWFLGGSTTGAVLLTGPGGVDVEIWQDVEPILLGAGAREIEAALRETRGFRLLEGFRNRPGYDVPALVETIRAVSEFLWRHRTRRLTVDLNPLLVGRPGEGVVAADALLLEET